MIDALLRADIAHVDHALDAFGHLHERAELLDAGHRTFHHRAHRELLRGVRPRIAQRLFEAERNAPVRRIHAKHHHFHRVARLDHIGGLAHLLGPGHLGEMHQAFDALFQFHERAEIGDARHAALDALADLVLLGHQVPGVRLKLLESERNPLLGGIHLEDPRLHLVAHLEHIGGLVDAAPGNVGHVQQRIHAADIDEGAVIGQAAHRALHGLAFLDLGVALVLVGALFLFEHRAAVHHHVRELGRDPERRQSGLPEHLVRVGAADPRERALVAEQRVELSALRPQERAERRCVEVERVRAEVGELGVERLRGEDPHARAPLLAGLCQVELAAVGERHPKHRLRRPLLARCHVPEAARAHQVHAEHEFAVVGREEQVLAAPLGPRERPPSSAPGGGSKLFSVAMWPGRADAIGARPTSGASSRTQASTSGSSGMCSA